MMSLTKKQTDILRLLQRSKPREDGWYEVSKAVWRIIDGGLPDDIAESRATADGGLLRFTLRGQAVADYL